MNICSIFLKTESSDEYLYIFEYSSNNDLFNQLKQTLGEEINYVDYFIVSILGGNSQDNNDLHSSIFKKLK